MNLRQFLAAYTVALPCTCSEGDKEGNISVGFFHVELKDAPADAAEQLKKLMSEQKPAFCDDVNPLDGQPHAVEELGAWLGDAEPALRLIAMGDLLGLWKAYVGDVVALVPTELLRQLEEQAAAITAGTHNGDAANDADGTTNEGTTEPAAANTAGGGENDGATIVASDATAAPITNAADVIKDAGAEGTEAK